MKDYIGAHFPDKMGYDQLRNAVKEAWEHVPEEYFIELLVLREYGHSLPIADGHPKILFVFMHGSHHAWNTV